MSDRVRVMVVEVLAVLRALGCEVDDLSQLDAVAAGAIDDAEREAEHATRTEPGEVVRALRRRARLLRAAHEYGASVRRAGGCGCGSQGHALACVFGGRVL